MKATKLTIGDWVLYNEAPQQVLEISSIDDEVYLEMDELVHQSEIRPIPLTPDMLLTNGFELQELGGEKISVWTGFGEDNCHDVEVEFEGIKPVYLKIDGPFYLTTSNIEYLHQLQHFLKDCETGIEITI